MKVSDSKGQWNDTVNCVERDNNSKSDIDKDKDRDIDGDSHKDSDKQSNIEVTKPVTVTGWIGVKVRVPKTVTIK